MALNSFFLHGSESEQKLIQSLVNEQLSMYGLEVAYLPQRFIRKETILREVTSSEFTDQYLIEAYLSNFDGYSGSGDILSKFGMQLKDEVTLIISKERFEDFISPRLANIPDAQNSTSLRPREGDLIYFPLGKRIFEIKFVEHEQPFYQLGKTYVYELRCELFEYSNSAVIATTNDDIDNSLQDFGYIKSLKLFASGSRATASAVLSKLTGYIKKITLVDDGYNYTTTPKVIIGSPPSAGTGASATATISIGGTVTDTNITSGGSYPTRVSDPKVTFSNPTGGGTETSIVKFGSRSYSGGDSGLTISTFGQSDRLFGSAQFWFYMTTFPPEGQQWTIARWGTNSFTDSDDQAQYELTVQTFNGQNQLFFYRPSADNNSGRFASTISGDISSDLNRWNWIKIAQASSSENNANRFSTHYAGSSESVQSSYTSETFTSLSNTQFLNDDGFTLNPDGDFSDGELFLDELRYSSVGSNTQPSIPTSTSKNESNTTLFQDGERVAATGAVVFNDNDVVTGITITDAGQNYTSAPTVSIDAPAEPIQATAVAISSCIGGFCSVREIYITNPGAGYTVAPEILISGTTGVGATATAEIETTYSGISTISITDGGSGYNSAPSVTFSVPNSVGVGTASATGIANISSAGIVTSVYLTHAGIGYITAPTLTISEPATITGVGTYIFNESVVGETSGTTAYVKSWDKSTNTLKVGNISGEFVDGEVIKGSTSNARYTINDLGENPRNIDNYEQNDEIQTESTSIIDFTETNLFGNY